MDQLEVISHEVDEILQLSLELEALSAEGVIVDTLSAVFSKISPALGDIVIKLNNVTDTSVEVDKRIRMLTKGSFKFKAILKDINLADYASEPFPVVEGLNTDILSFLDTLLPIIDSYRNKMYKDLDRAATILANLPKTDPKKIIAIHQDYFKKQVNEIEKDRKVITDLLDGPATTLRPLSTIINRFSDILEIFDRLNDLRSEIDTKELRKVRTKSKDLKTSLEVLRKNKEIEVTKELADFITLMTHVVASEMQYYSNSLYLALSTVGTIESIVKYVSNNPK